MKTFTCVVEDEKACHSKIIKQLHYFGNVARRPVESIENEVQFNIIEGKRDGRQQKTQWINNVMSAVKTTDLHLLIQMDKDQNVWRKLCHEYTKTEKNDR